MPKGVISGPWNYAVTYIEFFYNDTSLATGSGFFWEDGTGRLLLLSNWHNFSGRDPQTTAAIHSKRAIPNKLKFNFYRKLSELGNDNFTISLITETLFLKSEDGENNLWYEHPTLSRTADIAAIDITYLKDNQNLLNATNKFETDIIRDFYVAQDAFIVGYPLGLVSKSPPIPVWKRGTIATEPNIDPDQKQIVYVDSATRKSMSGSIVLTKELVMGSYKKKDGSESNTLFAQTTQILGIYSGRISPHNIEAQLGIVWKRNLIDEVVNGNKLANTSF